MAADWYLQALEESFRQTGDLDRFVGVEMAFDGFLAACSSAFDAAVSGLIQASERLKGGKTRSEFMRRAHTRGAGQELRVGRFKPLRRRCAVVDSGSRPAVDGAGRDSREPDRGGCETTRVPRAAGEAGLRTLARVPACSTSDGDRRIQIDFCRPTGGAARGRGQGLATMINLIFDRAAFVVAYEPTGNNSSRTPVCCRGTM